MWKPLLNTVFVLKGSLECMVRLAFRAFRRKENIFVNCINCGENFNKLVVSQLPKITKEERGKEESLCLQLERTIRYRRRKMKFKNLKMAGLCLCVMVSAVMLPKDYVSAQEATNDSVVEHVSANGGAPLKSEADIRISEEAQIKLLQKNTSQISEAQKKDLASKMKILNEEKELAHAPKTYALDDYIGEVEDDDLVDIDTEEDILAGKITYPKKKINVKHFKQEEPFYCGPATVKQTLHYLTGKSYKQSDIASGLGTTGAGTDGTRIPDYINDRQKKAYYIISKTTKASKLRRRIYENIGITNKPPIARLRFEQGGNWRYSTKGHFLNVSGYTDNIKKVHLTDPNITIADKTNKTGKYYVTFKAFQQAIKDHPDHHLYW